MVTIFRQALNLDSLSIERFKRYAMRGSPIFNPDKKRFQYPIRKSLKVIRNLEHILNENGLMEKRCIGSCVALCSLPGCKQQQWHTDYDPDQIEHITHKPLGIIVALQDDTYFCEFPNVKHHLQKGDILIFKGDVVHAGGAYSRENVRIHVYLDSIQHRRTRNKTYILRAP